MHRKKRDVKKSAGPVKTAVVAAGNNPGENGCNFNRFGYGRIVNDCAENFKYNLFHKLCRSFDEAKLYHNAAAGKPNFCAFVGFK
jgi:hypothetical protein